MEKTKTGRLQNSKKSMIFAIINFIVKLLCAFVVRKIFLKCLNETFLGVDTLFCNILDVLCFAELGIGSAMDCCLFKPAYEKDYDKMSKLMTKFKKIYMIIGSVVLILGLAVTPFIHIFMNSYPSDLNTNFYIIFVLFVVNAALSYLFSYRFSLFHAFQRKNVHYIITTSSYFVFSILQSLSLLIYKSYYLFVLCKIVYTLSSGFISYFYTKKKFGQVVDNCTEPIDIETNQAFKKEVGGVVCHKVASVVNTSADGIIISKFLNNGVFVLGVYSCYTMIISALNGLILCVCDALRGSLGNLIASNDLNNGYRVFSMITLLFWWISCFCATAVFCLINPFLDIFMGIENLFGLSTLFIIAFNFFIHSSKQGAWITRESFGKHQIDKYKGVIQASINIVLSIALVFIWGINGVLIATIISCLSTATWWDPYIVYNKWLKRSTKMYIFKYIAFVFVTTIIMAITYFVCSLISMSFVGFLIKIIICLVIPNVLLFLLFFKTKAFKELFKIIKNILGIKRRNHENSICE